MVSFVCLYLEFIVGVIYSHVFSVHGNRGLQKIGRL